MKVLVLNAGSSSVRYVVIDPDTGACDLEGKIERIGQGVSHEQAFSQILGHSAGIAIDAVGHRVVHGGARFHQASVMPPRQARSTELERDGCGVQAGRDR